VVGIEVEDGGLPRQRPGVAVEVEVVGDLQVSLGGEPRLDDAGAEPDVEIVLARVAAVGRDEGVGVPFDERSR